MTEKTLNTRILLKYDTLANWQSSTLILKAGELAIAVVGNSAIQNDNSLKGDANLNKTPIVGIKVGDGLKTFSQLNWIQAIAGDVPSWAKESDWATVKAAYNQAITEAISGLSTTGALKDLSNKVDGIAAGGTTNVGKVELITGITMKDGKVESYTTTPITTDMITAGSETLTEKLAAVDSAITQAKNDAISTAAGDATSKANAAQSAAATDATNKADAAKDAAIAAAKTETETQVGTLKTDLLGTGAVYKTDTIASVKQAAADALAAANAASTAAGNASAKVDTEIQKLDYTDTADNTKFVSKVDEVDGKISVTRVAVTDVLGIADSYDKSTNRIATVATVNTAVGNVRNELLEDIGEITGAMRFRGTVIGAPTSSTVPEEDGMGAFRKGDVLVDSSSTKEYICTGSSPLTWEELGAEGIYALSSDLEAHIQNYDTLNTKVTTDHEDRIGDLEETVGEHTTQISNKVEQTAYNTKIGEIETDIGNLENAVGEINHATNGILAQAKSHVATEIGKLDGTVSGTGDFIVSVTQTDGIVTATKGNVDITQVKNLKVIDGSETTGSAVTTSDVFALKGYVDTKAASAAANAIDTADIPGQIDAKINALDSSVAATAEANNQVSVLTGITQTDGKLTAKTETKLAAIAKTGNVNDLIQTTGDVLIFDCGGSGVTA